MDRGKKQGKFFANKNNEIYMNLKDIIREKALHYLPAKSLRRCTAICRDWKLQISTPFFAHSQSNYFRDVSGFFYQSKSGLPKFISIDPKAYGVPDPSFSFLPEPVIIRCASNGLVCCQGTTGYKAYYICNPVTKRWNKLPKPTADHGSDPAIVMAFEPSRLNFVAEYKLVVAFPSDLDGVEFEIYSSAGESWRISGEICFGDRKLVPSSGTFADGVVYWQSRSTYILAFDLTSERSTLRYGDMGASIGAANGKLCSCYTRGATVYLTELTNPATKMMKMGPMGFRNQTWMLKQQVDIDPSVFQGDRLNKSVLAFAGNMVAIQGKKKVLVCDMRTKVVKELGDDTNLGYGGVLIPYVNSLVEI